MGRDRVLALKIPEKERKHVPDHATLVSDDNRGINDEPSWRASGKATREPRTARKIGGVGIAALVMAGGLGVLAKTGQEFITDRLFGGNNTAASPRPLVDKHPESSDELNAALASHQLPPNWIALKGGSLLHIACKTPVPLVDPKKKFNEAERHRAEQASYLAADGPTWAINPGPKNSLLDVTVRRGVERIDAQNVTYHTMVDTPYRLTDVKSLGAFKKEMDDPTSGVCVAALDEYSPTSSTITIAPNAAAISPVTLPAPKPTTAPHPQQQATTTTDNPR